MKDKVIDTAAGVTATAIGGGGLTLQTLENYINVATAIGNFALMIGGGLFLLYRFRKSKKGGL